MGDDQRNKVNRPANPNATRDHLANERTLLAWVRSGIAIVALGFVVARFGLFLRELGSNGPRAPSGLATGIGVALVVAGAVLVVLATLRYQATERAIDDNAYQPSQGLLLALCGGFVVVAILLIVYLGATA